MQYEYCSCTDVGRVRTNNEDAACLDPQHHAVLLADGMGGYSAGEVAAHMAITGVRAELAAWMDQLPRPLALAPQQLGEALKDCIEASNRAIHRAALVQPGWAGMGTTLVAAVFCGTHVVLAHVGDSRCYRLRGSVLQQLTRDHSLLQEQLDAGMITPQQAARSTQRNLVTRALGVEDTVQVEVSEHRLHSGDLFLLCSDGLSEMLGSADLQAIAATRAPLQDKAQCLVNAANLNGGRDNITVLLVQAGTAPADWPVLQPPAPLLLARAPAQAAAQPHNTGAPPGATPARRRLFARWRKSA